MKKPQSIQLEIHKPCKQGWNNMHEAKGGRFCDSCNKTVIDFTHFTDIQLYDFFANQRSSVCGRINISQLNHTINIPPQPHSKLYRLAVAAGLTILALVPTNDIQAKFRVPLTIENVFATDEEPKPGDKTITIKGTVLNADGRPIPGAGLNLYKNGVWITNAFAYRDNGHFEFPPISYVEWSELEFEVFVYKYEKVIVKIDLENIKASYDIQLQIDSAALKLKMPEEIMYTGEVRSCFVVPPKNVGQELHKRKGDAETDCLELDTQVLH